MASLFQLFIQTCGRGATLKLRNFRRTREGASDEGDEEVCKKHMMTLGCGDLRKAVVLPEGETKEEWLALNTIDFCTEISLLWGLVCDESGVPKAALGKGFPNGYEYKIPTDGGGTRKCSGPEYVEFVLSWAEAQINDTGLFPTSPDTPFPAKYMDAIHNIYKRLFRIFAIIYSQYFSTLEKQGAIAHLNTCFKHFMFFVWQYDLVDNKELEALKELTHSLKVIYNGDGDAGAGVSSSGRGSGSGALLGGGAGGGGGGGVSSVGRGRSSSSDTASVAIGTPVRTATPNSRNIPIASSPSSPSGSVCLPLSPPNSVSSSSIKCSGSASTQLDAPTIFQSPTSMLNNTKDTNNA